MQNILKLGCISIFALMAIAVVIGFIANIGSSDSTESLSIAPQLATVMAPTSTPIPANEQQAATAKPASTNTPKPAPIPTARFYVIGDDVQVGDIRWRALEFQDLGNTLESDNEFIKDVTTAGRFVRIRFEVENLGNEQVYLANIKIVDDRDRAFSEASGVFYWIPEQESCILTTLNPNVPDICNAIYDIAQDAVGLKLKVTNLQVFFEDSELIVLQ